MTVSGAPSACRKSGHSADTARAAVSVAGRVIVETAPSKFESRLVRVARPVLRIPSLAIHLNREVSQLS